MAKENNFQHIYDLVDGLTPEELTILQKVVQDKWIRTGKDGKLEVCEHGDQLVSLNPDEPEADDNSEEESAEVDDTDDDGE